MKGPPKPPEDAEEDAEDGQVQREEVVDVDGDVEVDSELSEDADVVFSDDSRDVERSDDSRDDESRDWLLESDVAVDCDVVWVVGVLAVPEAIVDMVDVTAVEVALLGGDGARTVVVDVSANSPARVDVVVTIADEVDEAGPGAGIGAGVDVSVDDVVDGVVGGPVRGGRLDTDGPNGPT